jgi:hypothetical protein
MFNKINDWINLFFGINYKAVEIAYQYLNYYKLVKINYKFVRKTNVIIHVFDIGTTWHTYSSNLKSTIKIDYN